MVSSETLLSYPDWIIPFTVHTDVSDKQLDAVISHNNKPTAFFSRIFSKPRRNYTTNEKELLAIVECLKKFRSILFGYEINVLSYHKNLVYATTLSEYQQVIRWILIIGAFGPNIQHIAVVDNIVSNSCSRLPSTPINKYDNCTRNSQSCVNESFTLGRIENNEDSPPLNLLVVQREQ